MVTVMLAMTALSMLAVGAYAGTVGDMPIARKDQDRKGAYEAAQAGVDWYMNLLRADPEYWTQCAPTTASNQVPLTLEGTGSQGRGSLSAGLLLRLLLSRRSSGSRS